MNYPNIDPVAVELFGFSIRWYGVMYLLGLGIAALIGRQLLKQASFSSLRGILMEDLLVAAAIGVIVGGRLGYVLFYNPAYYAEHPAEILYLWNGGMAFHGGLLGVIVSLWALARLHTIPDVRQAMREEGLTGGEEDEDDDDDSDDSAALETVTSHKTIFLRLADLAAVMTPPGLGLGRLGNFINGELPGRVASADLPWAMRFGVPDYLPRHPSQLYQLLIEGFLLTALMLYLARAPRAPGWLAGAFLSAYAAGRFFVEFFREPDSHLGLLFLQLSMGQLLCIPMFLLGLAMLYRLRITAWAAAFGERADVIGAETAAPDKSPEYSDAEQEAPGAGEKRPGLKALAQRFFTAAPDSSWQEHEQTFADNYGDDEDDEEPAPGRISGFFSRLFGGGEEEEELAYTRVRLTRQQKRRLKKKKRKKS